MIGPLLPRDALTGVRLGLSASESPDLARLGLDPRHFRVALGEMARLVLAGGGTLAWGGHLDPRGLTPFLIDEVKRYGREDYQGLLVFLAWPVHRALALSDLAKARDTIDRYGQILCLDPNGAVIEKPESVRGEAPEPVVDPLEKAKQLTAMRRTMRQRTQGRLMIGGRRSGFEGRMPGLVEEALMTVEARQPLYLAAGLGGATADIARAAGLEMGWLASEPGAPPEDPAMTKGLADLRATLTRRPLVTGLDDQDLTTLACTHRPSEIATLVARGLGSVFANRRRRPAKKGD